MDLDQVKSYNEDVAKLREQRDADYAEYEKAGRIWGLVPRERITKIKFPRVKKEIIDRYYALEDMSTTVSDILDGYGTVGKSCGFAGNIVNGCCRDVSSIREMGYPVFSCGTTQVTGKYRMECVEMNGPITLCGKLVEPGDLMVADDSGVCIVPAELAEAVIEEAEKIAASEERMRQLIEEKKPISELRPLFRARYK